MARATRNWILLLILTALGAYGAARLAVWYSVTDTVAGARDALAPVASLEHAKTLSPVLGAAGVTGIRIRPHAVPVDIRIGSALVHSEDLLEKYRLVRAALGDTTPERLNFSLNRIQLDLSAETASLLDRSAAASSPAGPAPACETQAAFGMQALRDMGYDALLASLHAEYDYDRPRGALVAYARLVLEDMFEISLESRFPPGALDFNAGRAAGMPRLAGLTLSFSDRSWASRFNSYCAAALGISEARFIDRQMARTRQWLSARGFEPSDELMSAMETVTRGEGDLPLNLNPRDPVALTGLMAVRDPAALVDTLGLEVLVDGRPVSGLGAASEGAPQQAGPAAAPVRRRYRPTGLAELPQFLDRRIRVFTRDGRVLPGSLDAVQDGKIIVTRHLAGGSATIEVERGEVDRVLVFR